MMKRGLSAVVTTLILVMLAIAAIIIVWFAVSSILDKNEGDIAAGLSRMTLDVVSSSVCYNESGNYISLKVNRDEAEGELSKIKIILTDDSGEETSDDFDATDLNPLEGKTFRVSTGSLLPSKIEVIQVAPIAEIDGEETLGKVTDRYEDDNILVCGSQNNCVPGATKPCSVGGYSGSQACLADGSGYGACSTVGSCGDGIVNGATGAENCDDGNNANGDGCSASCSIESGWTCGGTPTDCWKWVYQENGDQYGTSGEWVNPQYLNDGNWNTQAYENYNTYDPLTDTPLAIYYVNYTKPAGATSQSRWKVKSSFSGTEVNGELELLSCWSTHPSKLIFRVTSKDQSAPDRIRFYCLDGTTWRWMAQAQGSGLYEEAMNWSINP